MGRKAIAKKLVRLVAKKLRIRKKYAEQAISEALKANKDLGLGLYPDKMIAFILAVGKPVAKSGLSKKIRKQKKKR